MQTTSSPHPVFLVDDHILVRNGIKGLIEHNPAYAVQMQYDNGKQFVSDFPFSVEPSIILLDIAMPLMDGKTVMEWLKERELNYPVLILTLDTSDKTIIEFFKLGARGYLSKTCTFEVLMRAMDDIINSGYYHNELLTNALLANEGSKKDERQKVIDKITEREMNFLKLVCHENEYTYEQMTDIMHVHRRTIDGYRESLFDKFNIKSKTGLVLFALKYQLLNILKDTH